MPSATPFLTLPFFLLLLLLLLLLPSTLANPLPCSSFCRYRLCSRLLRDGNLLQKENRLFSLSFPNEPLGPFPCIERSTGLIQSLRNVTGSEALVAPRYSTDNYIPISRYQTKEHDPNFPKSVFSWVENPETGESALQRMALTPVQRKVLDGLCVRMPISSFRTRQDGSRRKTSSERDCVGFRPVSTKLDVKFEWSTANDFDVRLVEPGGFEINRFAMNFESRNGGKLVSDNGARTCQVVLGKEQIVYVDGDTVEKGLYTIRINQFRVCERFSRFRLRVLYEEELIFEDSGVVDGTIGTDVIVRQFRI